MTGKGKIIVTGSTGYLGSVLIPSLIKEGYDCVGFDNGFFADALLYPVPAYKTIKKDARDISPEDLQGAIALVHFAAISNDPYGKLSAEIVYNPTRIYARQIALMCKKASIKFIFASSCSVYGVGKDELIDENSETHPQTPYSLNKIQIEQDLADLSEPGFSPIILRFATAYGLSPRIRFDLVINMLCGMAITKKEIVLNSDGLAWRPFVHVEDIVQAISCAIASPWNEGRPLVLNAGATTDNFQIQNIASIISKAAGNIPVSLLTEKSGASSELVFDRKIKQGGADTRTYRVSFEQIKKAFPGYSCAWNVPKGIAQMVGLFTKLPLTVSSFENRGFYRLQRMEDLFASGAISPDARPTH